MGIFTFIADAGIVGWIILGTGGAVMALTVERIRVLYFQYGMNVDAFTSKIQNLVFTKKIDEAIVTCVQWNYLCHRNVLSLKNCFIIAIGFFKNHFVSAC